MADDSAFAAGQFDPPAILLFVAVEIALPAGGWLRLLDGAGEVSFGGRTFTGQDPVYGVLTGLEPIADGFGDTAPGLRLGIFPPTANAAAILAGADMQGANIMLWVGTMAGATGAVNASPVLVFVGEVDQGVLTVSLGSRRLDLECVSIWERLFDDAQGVRLSNSYHQSAWPGERGLEFVTDIQRTLPWGADAPRPDVITDARPSRN